VSLPAIFGAVLPEESIADLIDLIDKTVRTQEGGRWWMTLERLAKLHGAPLARRALRHAANERLLTQARAQFGEDIRFFPQYCILRYYDPAAGGALANWHFDANILGPDVAMMNFWIPLVDVGVTSPGITLVTTKRAPEAVWRHLANVAAKDGRISDANRKLTLYDDAAIAKELEENPLHQTTTPVIPAGGALAFDHQILHRTQFLTDGMTPRYSFEVRVVADSVAETLQRQTGFVFAKPEQILHAS